MPPVKRKRVITDRRREQNRDAQKIYRAKVKDRLLQLETLKQEKSTSGEPHVQDEQAVIDGRGEQSLAELSDDLVSKASSQDLDRRPSPGSLEFSSQAVGPAIGQGLTIRPYTSDPRLNHLAMPYISLISAGIENTLSFNISKTQALTPGFPSPFCGSTSMAGTDTLRPSWWSSIPRDLYPTSLQLSIPHQVWIDSIPIPSFRDGALAYLAAERVNDHNFSLSGLADDIDNGGLVCWGGSGRKSGGTGTPWDARSWEARPWFLIKWKYVTGGLDGELGSMSMWWWRLKGEKFDAPA